MKKLLIALGIAVTLVGVALLAAGAMHVGEKPGKLTWRPPEFRSALMTFAYKVYGNRKAESGRHYLSKITFTNSGQRPITDFSISYKLEDYIPWTDPETMPEIPGGFSFVKLYYPRLPAEVAKLRTSATCPLQVRVKWKEDGKEREETFHHDVLLHAVNELAYCDLPSNEVETWFDLFDASDFAVSMVTPSDPVVAAYASEISKMAGGTTAGIAGGGKEVYRLCQVAYEYMTRTGLRYTGDSGVPANVDNVSTMVQAVRLPRDVILNNNGLCIELAIMWASVLEHLGINAMLVMVPGHCYVIAYSPSQGVPADKGIPIETTSITPQAVGEKNAVSFDDSVKMAVKETDDYAKDGRMIFLPVTQYQQAGFTPPELPDVDVTKITDTLEKRLAPAPAQGRNYQVATENTAAPTQQQDAAAENVPQQQAPPEQTLAPPKPNGTIRWQHPYGYVTIDFPANFVTIKPAVNPGNVLLLCAGNQATTLECNVMQVVGTEDPGIAWQYIKKSCTKYNIRLNLTASKIGERGMVFYGGTTNVRGNISQWLAAGKPVRNGVVFVSAGVNQYAWKTQYNNIISLMNNVHFQ